MKFADEFRDADLARALGAKIAGESGDRHWKIMEVCGGHTHTIFQCRSPASPAIRSPRARARSALPSIASPGASVRESERKL